MKSYKILTMMLVTMVLPLIVSCGSSDDENASSPETPNLPLTKRLVKVSLSRPSSISNSTYDYIYDDHGRVTQIKENNTTKIYTYSSDDNTIIESVYSGSTEYWQNIYTLENGRIIKMYNGKTKATSNYNYQNGHLIFKSLITSEGELSKVVNYNWSNDNLISVEINGFTYTYEYSNYLCPQGFCHFYNDEWICEFGGMSNFFGKTIKYLPSKIIDRSFEYIYDWTMKDGLPVKLHYSISGDKERNYVFEWE